MTDNRLALPHPCTLTCTVTLPPQDPRLRCRCSKCKRMMRLNPFYIENPFHLLRGVERIVGPGARALAAGQDGWGMPAKGGSLNFHSKSSRRASRRSRRSRRHDTNSSRTLSPGRRLPSSKQAKQQSSRRHGHRRHTYRHQHPATGTGNQHTVAPGQLYATTARKHATLRAAGALPEALASSRTGLGVELPSLPAAASARVRGGANVRGATMRGNGAAGTMREHRRATRSFQRLPAVV